MTTHKMSRWGAVAMGTALAAGLLSACGDAGATNKPDQEAQQPSGEQTNAQETSTPSPFAADSLQATLEQKDGKDVVTNSTSMRVVVNKQRYLPDGYEPSDLVIPNVPFSYGDAEAQEKSHLRKEAAEALEQLFEGAKAADIELYAVSGYRSYARQKNIYDRNVSIKGALSVNNDLEQTFGDTEEGRWLADHAQEYGFIVHYLKGKEQQTGYSYEPWHIRYVGKELAEAVHASGLSLEEYLDESNLNSGK